MATAELWANWIGPPSTSTPVDAYEAAVNFTTSSNGYITHVGWYRATTGASAKPSALRLWRRSDNSLLATAPSVPDTVTVGWQWVALSTPIAITTGITYSVAMAWPANQTWAYMAKASRPLPLSPLSWGANFRSWYFPGTGSFPSSQDDTLGWMVDARYSDTTNAPDPSGTVGQEIENALARWLDQDDYTRGDSLPLLARNDTQTILSRLGTDLTGLGNVNATLKDIWDFAGALADAEISLFRSFFQTASTRLTGSSGGGGSAFYAPSGDLIGQVVDDSAAQLRWLTGEVLALPYHVLEATSLFTGQQGWGSGYPLHHVHISGWDAGQGVLDLGAAGTWLPRIGWWAPMLADGSIGERRYLEFADQWLWPCPRSTAGVVVWVHPATTGTLTAYSVS